MLIIVGYIWKNHPGANSFFAASCVLWCMLQLLHRSYRHGDLYSKKHLNLTSQEAQWEIRVNGEK